MGEERRRILHNLDRIEDRLRDAPSGLHEPGPEASPGALAASGLEPDVALLWGAYDGLELGAGEARILPLAEHEAATRAAADEGRLRPGDRVIGERGRDLLVLAADPHAEGADVVLVEEDGERLPYASTVDRLVLALLGEFSVLFDEDGEYQADLFGDDGELTPAAERRLLRRHLDLDPDAPLARFRLAQSLRRAGELRGADAELRQLLRRAPEFVWGHLELGRVRLGEGRSGSAAASFLRAAELAGEPGLRAHCLALACLAQRTGPSAQDPSDRPAPATRTGDSPPTSTPPAADSSPPSTPPADDSSPASTRPAADSSPASPPPASTRTADSSPPDDAWARTAAAALAANPRLPAAQEAAVRDALERDDLAAAEEQLALGLAVVPGHLGLLSLRPALAELRARLAADVPAELPDDDPDADVDPAIRDDDAERLARPPARETAQTPKNRAKPQGKPATAARAPGTGSASSPYGGRTPARSSGGRRTRRPARSRG